MKGHERRTHSHLLNSVPTALSGDGDDDTIVGCNDKDSVIMKIQCFDKSGDLKYDKILMKDVQDGDGDGDGDGDNCN